MADKIRTVMVTIELRTAEKQAALKKWYQGGNPYDSEVLQVTVQATANDVKKPKKK